MMCSADDRASRNSSRLFAYACGIRRTFFEGSNDHASRDSSDPFAYACGIRRTFRFCHACSANIEHGVLTLLFRENLVHILWTFCAREKISFTHERERHMTFCVRGVCKVTQSDFWPTRASIFFLFPTREPTPRRFRNNFGERGGSGVFFM